MADDKSCILFIDDEPFILSTLRDLFDDEYRVFTAATGKEGLEILKREEIKVIVSDQRMPGMLGHQVLREARNIKPNTVRMLLTGYSDLEAILSSVNAGEVFRYINKPWNTESLTKLISLSVNIYDKVQEVQTYIPESIRNKSGANQFKTHLEVQEKSIQVLFVDFNPPELNRLVETYSKSCETLGATTVDEAFKTLAKTPVSVVVSNVNFNEEDPINFLSAIGKEYPQIVTVILTEVKDATLAVRSINELNVFKYLIKPSDEPKLEETIIEAAKKNSHYRETPEKNIRRTAETLIPDSGYTSAEESALRLRLRAAQSILSRTPRS
ncbi:MAG: response regulator [Chloroherpetonaceae bacterium]|nr:response regulator [Chloroherpetonaceae bacterium]